MWRHIFRLSLNRQISVTTINPSLTMSRTNSKSKAHISTSSSTAAAAKKPVHKYKFEVLPSPVKGEKDTKEYRVIRLENGLTACLISDMENYDQVAFSDSEDSDSDYEDEGSEEGSDFEDMPSDGGAESDGENGMKAAASAKEKMAAAALCVGVGSFSDPGDVPGLAHFLEHMVFMGSEKFPQENDFDSFISKKGGEDNASTDCETTTFYFECLEKYLLRSLDKFAQFFISPLMKRGSMTREREAIESEFQAALPNDTYRIEQLLTNLFNPKVPINSFTWGNLQTLCNNISDDKLYTKLHEFRKRHYSAHRMTLAIQARLPMDTLQEYVVDCFSTVPNNGLPADDFKQYAHEIYNTPEFNRLYHLKPTNNCHKVDLVWVLPSLLHMYKSKPHQYYSWLLGGEGKGSLLAYLRKKVWALGILAGNSETGSEHNSMYAYFPISVTLTEDGLAHLDEVIELVFSYINLLKKVGPSEKLFNEIQLVEETSFRFAEEKDPVDVVESMADSMQFYPSEDYLTGSELYFEYSPELLNMVLNHLRPDNVNIMVSNITQIDGMQYNKTEPWFKTQYTDTAIPNEWLERWTNVDPHSEFSLPDPNQFLTTDFSLIPKVEPLDFKIPKQVLKTDSLELWYKPDTHFKIPQASYNFYLINPICIDSPKNYVMMELFINMVAIQMIEEIYPASVAELSYSIGMGDMGLQLKIYGFNEKLPMLLELLTRYLKNAPDNLDLNMFNAVKEKQKCLYHNKFQKPSTLSKDVRLSILLQKYWTALDKYTAIDDISIEMLKTFSINFLHHLYVQSFITGNVLEKTAIEVAEKFVKTLKFTPLPFDEIPKTRVTQLPKGEHCIRMTSFNKEDANSYITNYYQSGPSTLKDSVIIEILMMMIEEPLFDILRTKEQLGYTVYALLRDTHDILGYSVTVNTHASKATTSRVDSRIESFVKTNASKLVRKMADKKLGQLKKDLIKLKRCQDTQLRDECSRFWDEIVTRHYVFERREMEVAIIEAVKMSEIRKFWEEINAYGSKNNFRKLTVQVIGHKIDQTKKDAVSHTAIAEDKGSAITDIPYQLDLVGGELKEKRSDHYFIKDIPSFKAGLSLFPSKTNLTSA